MASPANHCYAYMLVGFGSDLDYRPTDFLEPFPVSRICGVCGVVPDEVALLPCCDVVCRTCYNRCAEDSGCALHSGARLEAGGDVYWRPLTLTDVAERKVRCWNAKNGCDVLLALRDVACHFSTECQFHNVICRRCYKNVLRADIVQHLRRGCGSRGLEEGRRLTPDGRSLDDAYASARSFVSNVDAVEEDASPTDSQTAECSGSPRDDDVSPRQKTSSAKEQTACGSGQAEAVVYEYPVQTSFDGTATEANKATHDRTHDDDASPRQEMSAANERVSYDRREGETVVMERLNVTIIDGLANGETPGTSGGPNDVPSSSLEDEQRNAAVVTTRPHLMAARNIEALEQLREQAFGGFEKCLEMCRDTVEVAWCAERSLNWVVTGWAQVKEKASVEGGAWYYSQPGYLRGYHLSSAIFVRRSSGGELKVHIGLVLRRGVIDEHLEWPFCRRVRLTFVHPEMRSKPRFLTLTPNSATAGGKPNEGAGMRFYSTGRYCFAGDLENEGYVRDDHLRVSFEVAS
ncbi:hypothetical protein HPB48_008846 [Haemaphysalis longicornis]|uniref:TRAF1-6 MATH domain-containing protein n=1 Tax=Haemaphysalis longicornis TaxID=44386 RepID=A0A9J6H238_HAELO|nr:hypothetical protein HPB48_008846 [Haemaphysalis longicornis]